jgi:hypothetical protein
VNVVESLGELEEPQQTRIHHLAILNRVKVNLMAKIPRIAQEIITSVPEKESFRH